MSSTALHDESSTDSVASLAQLYRIGLVLAAVTGAIHLWLGIARGSAPLFLAGVGFVAGVTAVVADVRRRAVIEYGIPFTAVQVVLYAVAHLPNRVTWVGALDKLVQIGLVVVLFAITKRD